MENDPEDPGWRQVRNYCKLFGRKNLLQPYLQKCQQDFVSPRDNEIIPSTSKSYTKVSDKENSVISSKFDSNPLVDIGYEDINLTKSQTESNKIMTNKAISKVMCTVSVTSKSEINEKPKVISPHCVERNFQTHHETKLPSSGHSSSKSILTLSINRSKKTCKNTKNFNQDEAELKEIQNPVLSPVISHLKSPSENIDVSIVPHLKSPSEDVNVSNYCFEEPLASSSHQVDTENKTTDPVENLTPSINIDDLICQLANLCFDNSERRHIFIEKVQNILDNSIDDFDKLMDKISKDEEVQTDYVSVTRNGFGSEVLDSDNLKTNTSDKELQTDLRSFLHDDKSGFEDKNFNSQKDSLTKSNVSLEKTELINMIGSFIQYLEASFLKESKKKETSSIERTSNSINIVNTIESRNSGRDIQIPPLNLIRSSSSNSQDELISVSIKNTTNNSKSSENLVSFKVKKQKEPPDSNKLMVSHHNSSSALSSRTDLNTLEKIKLFKNISNKCQKCPCIKSFLQESKHPRENIISNENKITNSSHNLSQQLKKEDSLQVNSKGSIKSVKSSEKPITHSEDILKDIYRRLKHIEDSTKRGQKLGIDRATQAMTLNTDSTESKQNREMKKKCKGCCNRVCPNKTYREPISREEKRPKPIAYELVLQPSDSIISDKKIERSQLEQVIVKVPKHRCNKKR